MTQWVVDARSVIKSFLVKESGQVVHALNNVSLTVNKGTLTALVGPDGAGKTTLLRLIAGLLQGDSGQISVLGVDVRADPQAVQNQISYMPQRFGLYEDLSVRENMELYADLHGVIGEVRHTRFARLLKMTDLAQFTDRMAGKLSGGMKQKLALACTLVRSPELLLLDEPTVGVDPLSRRELWEIVNQLVQDENLTVLFTTAFMDEAEGCSEVYLLHQGQLLDQGPPAKIRQHAAGLCYLATPKQGEPARQLQTRLLDQPSRITDAQPQGGKVRFIQRRGVDEASLQLLLAGIGISAVEPRLEDGFMVLLRADDKGDVAPIASSPDISTEASSNAAEMVIDVQDLVRRFGDFVAVASTNFTVKRGEIFGLLGPNGAGKTTTFRMLCGLLPASSGNVLVAGVSLRQASVKARQRIGYVAQKFSLYGNLSVVENLKFFGAAYGLFGKHLAQRIHAVSQQFDLLGQEKKPTSQLPGGYKQRLAMAVALLHEPDILFLDEPTSGADPLARRSFWRRITALAAGGTTIIITTHLMEEAEYCDRIVIQDAGHILSVGTPQEVREQAAGEKNANMTMEQAFIQIVEKGRGHMAKAAS